jgi:DNA-binding SARP family transcriptional activator
MRQHIGAQRFQHDEVLIGGLIERLRERIGADAFERAFADGLRIQPTDAIDEVIGPTAAAPEEAAGRNEVAGHAGAGARDKAGVQDDVAAHDHVAAYVEPAPRDATTAAADSPSAATPRPAVSDGLSVGTDEQVNLDVCALGRLEVVVDGTPIESWPYAKPREMLAYLVLRPQGRTRSEIGAALWPDAAPAQVRNSFHVTMHHVRKTLGHADWVILDGERYRIAPKVHVVFDVTRFQEQARAAMAISGAAAIAPLREALNLYRGHFLADEPFGSWRDEVQDGLRRTYCDAGLRLGGLLAAAEDVAEAADVYEKVVACEPLHEAAHRGLLLTLTRAGRRAHALRHYERLTALLLELELEPEEETLELYERIRTADIVPLSSNDAVAM